MHLLALLVELAAIATPVIGIVIELRRDLSDDDEGGLWQGAFAPRDRLAGAPAA